MRVLTLVAAAALVPTPAAVADVCNYVRSAGASAQGGFAPFRESKIEYAQAFRAPPLSAGAECVVNTPPGGAELWCKWRLQSEAEARAAADAMFVELQRCSGVSAATPSKRGGGRFRVSGIDGQIAPLVTSKRASLVMMIGNANE